MIHIGTQYYRAPFPDSKYWEDDFRRIADSGLNTVQLWVLWGWVEPSPGEFLFDDYDRLVELADRHRLGVVLSTIAEIHPYWIHREVPGSEMVTNMGIPVVSSNRAECHFGLTPGGCIDHPEVWDRMRRFLEAVVLRYRTAQHLVGWDAWNELRWNVHADGLVCYCDSSLKAFRGWLDQRYGGLDGLNRAWKRRYRSWEDVRPGKAPDRPYTEMMAFEHFITDRCGGHARQRYEVIKGLDPDRPVTVHGANPCVLHADRFPDNTPLHRGNDWDLADALDGIGCSSFPMWGNMDDDEFTVRINYLTSAAGPKRIWISELQGGRASSGRTIFPPVPPDRQQRWLWTGIAGKAETLLFWCWRDEVFARESSGFGMAGSDGLAEPRLAAMAKTGSVLRTHEELLDAYRPDDPQAGVYFSPQSYYLHWAQNGDGILPLQGVQAYSRALTRLNVAHRTVEEEHLGALEGLRILYLPRAVVLDPRHTDALAAWVRAGGRLVCESECGAYGTNGIWRYPQDRFLAELTGVREIGRRTLEGCSMTVRYGGRPYQLPASQWLTPLAGEGMEVLGEHPDGALAARIPVGAGEVMLLGTFVGEGYTRGMSGLAEYQPYMAAFEDFLLATAGEAGVAPVAAPAGPPDVRSSVHVKLGRSGDRSVAFAFFRDDLPSVTLRLPSGRFTAEATEILSGQRIALTPTQGGDECTLPRGEWGVAILAGG